MNPPFYTPPPREPEPSEFLADALSVNDRKCIGCMTHGKDIMISFTRKGDPVVYDLFLTHEQATTLVTALLPLVARPSKHP